MSLTAPPGTELGAADEPLDAAIAPDQREIVFVATRRGSHTAGQPPAGTSQLWRRRLDAERAEVIPGTDAARMPAWKETGNVMSFFAGGRLKLIDLSNAAVADVADAPAPAGAAWLKDGSLLFVPGPGPVRRLLDGRITDATRLAPGDAAHAFPTSAGSGRDFVYVAVRDDGRRVVRLSSGGQENDLGTTAAHAALVEPWLLSVRDSTLLVDYRDNEGRMAGNSLALVLDVGTTRLGRGLFTASKDVLLHASAAERPRRLVWLDMRGAQAGAVADVGDYWQVRLSADDRRLAVTTRDPLLRSLDVLMIPVDAAAATLRLTTAVAADSDPVWSPDGDRLLFRSMQRGRPEVFVTATTTGPATKGESAARSIAAGAEVPTDWRDNEMLVQRRGTSGFDLVRVDTTSGAVQAVADSTFNETEGRWSPDGRWIAFVSDESGRPDVYVVGAPAQNAETLRRVSFGGGTHPRWTRDGRALLFLRGSTIMRVDFAAATAFAAPQPLFEVPGVRDFDVAHRSDRIVASIPVRTDPVDAASVIVNWSSLAEAERRRSQKPTPPKF